MNRLAVWLVCVSTGIACGGEREQAPPAAAGKVGEAIVVVAERGPVYEWASGSVASARHTIVASRVLATIDDVRVRSGAEVAVGDVLVVLDARDLEAGAQEAEQAHAAARARLVLAEREAERLAHLVAEGVATVQDSDRAAANLRVARADVARAERALEAARIAKSHTEIHSPVAGRVVDRLAEPGDTATPGKPLLRIYDPSVLRVEAPVRESLAVKLHLGALLAVEVESLDLRVEGAVDEIVPFAETGARTLLVKVRLPADARLYAGLFARLAIPAGERMRLLIPESAVVREGQLEQVEMADAAGAARLRVITTGERLSDGRIEVLSGLQEGETDRRAHGGRPAAALRTRRRACAFALLVDTGCRGPCASGGGGRGAQAGSRRRADGSDRAGRARERDRGLSRAGAGDRAGRVAVGPLDRAHEPQAPQSGQRRSGVGRAAAGGVRRGGAGE
jgi:membrane fusion protein (multidrug efflux system)